MNYYICEKSTECYCLSDWQSMVETVKQTQLKFWPISARVDVQMDQSQSTLSRPAQNERGKRMRPSQDSFGSAVKFVRINYNDISTLQHWWGRKTWNVSFSIFLKWLIAFNHVRSHLYGEKMARERRSPSQSAWVSFYMRKKVTFWPDPTRALAHAQIVSPWPSWGWLSESVYSYFEKGCRKKNVHATIPKGNMGYDQYTVPDTVAVKPTFAAFL